MLATVAIQAARNSRGTGGGEKSSGASGCVVGAVPPQPARSPVVRSRSTAADASSERTDGVGWCMEVGLVGDTVAEGRKGVRDEKGLGRDTTMRRGIDGIRLGPHLKKHGVYAEGLQAVEHTGQLRFLLGGRRRLRGRPVQVQNGCNPGAPKFVLRGRLGIGANCPQEKHEGQNERTKRGAWGEGTGTKQDRHSMSKTDPQMRRPCPR